MQLTERIAKQLAEGCDDLKDILADGRAMYSWPALSVLVHVQECDDCQKNIPV